MDTLRFRAMAPMDLDAVLAIERASFDAPWTRRAFAEKLARHHTVCYVALVGSSVVAYAAVAFLEGRRAHLLNFAVTPDQRRRGIGRRFLEFLDDVARMRECERIDLDVRESNLDAQLFYRSQGFRAVRVLRKFYENTGEDAYRMRRPLAAAPHPVEE